MLITILDNLICEKYIESKLKSDDNMYETIFSENIAQFEEYSNYAWIYKKVVLVLEFKPTKDFLDKLLGIYDEHKNMILVFKVTVGADLKKFNPDKGNKGRKKVYIHHKDLYLPLVMGLLRKICDSISDREISTKNLEELYSLIKYESFNVNYIINRYCAAISKKGISELKKEVKYRSSNLGFDIFLHKNMTELNYLLEKYNPQYIYTVLHSWIENYLIVYEDYYEGKINESNISKYIKDNNIKNLNPYSVREYISSFNKVAYEYIYRLKQYTEEIKTTSEKKNFIINLLVVM